MDNLTHFEELNDGTYSEDEILKILNQNGIDPKIALEIRFQNELNEALRDKNFFEFRRLLKDKLKHQSSEIQFKNQRNIIKTWHLAAASFTLLLVIGGLWYILSNKTYSTERLLSKYYKPAHPILQVRSVEMNSDDALKEAFNFYQQNDYTNALKYFSTIDNQITAKFYSGVCYIELEQYDKAITSFEYVVNDKDNLFIEQAEWYMGLIFLMNNQKNRAIDQFKRISGSKSYYSNQAEEILKYLY